MIASKPFRIIVEQIQGYWVVSRTDAQGFSAYYSRVEKFRHVGKLIDLLLQERLLCRECKNCKVAFSPLRGNQECCSQDCGKKGYKRKTSHRILTMQEIADKNNYSKGEALENEQIHDQTRDIETPTERSQLNQEPSGSSVEEFNRHDIQGNTLDGFICVAERGTLQEVVTPRENSTQPTDGRTNNGSEQASSEVCTSETTSRHDSEQVGQVPLRANRLEAKPLRTKEVNLTGQGGYYKCKYCGLPKYHAQGAPFPIFCPPCEALIQKDRQKAESKPASFKTLEAFKKSGHELKGIEDRSIKWK